MANNRKVKILFVHSQLVQHGSERYLYELCNSIDKNVFDVHILTRFFLIKNNYYYPILLNMGCKIHTRLLSIRYLRYPIQRLYIKYKFVRTAIKSFHFFLCKIIYRNFFNQFDIIAPIGIETYCDTLSPLLDTNTNLIIHHVTHQYQFERNYFEECKQRKFVLNDDQQEFEITKYKGQDIDIYRLPLPMNFDSSPNIGITKEYNNIKIKIKIAVFSRLYKDRPNEPLFNCFAEFLQRYSSAELFFYGSGDSNQYKDLLIKLGISQSVYFQGHSTSIPESIIKDNIDILWLVSMGKSISYSSLEISSLGMPMVFWNLNATKTEEVLKDTGSSINTFNNLKDFINYNTYILDNPNELKANGQRMREYVMNYFDIKKNIRDLEKFYLKNSIN